MLAAIGEAICVQKSFLSQAVSSPGMSRQLHLEIGMDGSCSNIPWKNVILWLNYKSPKHPNTPHWGDRDILHLMARTQG